MRIQPRSLIRALALCLMLVPGVQAQMPSQAVREAVTRSRPSRPAAGLGPVQIERLDAPGTAVVQDPQGFMWFGGQSGLYRYDGHGYTHYRHDPQDATSLAHNWVECLYVDRDGTLWVGTFGGGLHRFDPATETFTRYRHDPANPASLSQDSVTVLLEDRQGTFWVGTHGGLDRFDRETGTFTHYRHDPNDPASLSNDQVRALLEDHLGTLWVGTGDPTLSITPAGVGGLNRFDPTTGTFTRYLHDPRDETSLIDNQIMSLYEDAHGTLWVGTLGDGLHTMDREAGTFTRHRYDPDDPAKLSRPFVTGTLQVDEACASWACGGVSFIHEDLSGILWIGGHGGGVNRYDPRTGAMSHHEASPSGLVNNLAWTISESHDGTLWIGTWGGMHKVVAAANAFPHVKSDPTDPNSLGGLHVQGFHEDHEGMLWISLWLDGLDRLDRSTGVFTHVRPNADGTPASLGSDDAVMDLYEDRTGALWIGQYGVLNRFDRETGTFIHYRHDPNDLASLSDRLFFALHGSDDGRLWIGTDGDGLNLFDPATGIVKHHRHDPDDPGSLSHNAVLTLYEDSTGTLWTGTEDGLNRLARGPTVAFTTYLSGRTVTSLYEDRRGRFWVGTAGDGLYLFDRGTGQSTRYGLDEGLASINVMGLAEDDDGHLWISTAKGLLRTMWTKGRLSRLDPETETFTTFDTRDGLPDIGFLPNSVLKLRDGTLIFGGNGGYIAFDPATIRDPVYQPPKMALTGLRVFNDEVVPGPEAPLRAPIHVAKEIRLSYGQSDFTIDYAALTFRNPGEIKYHYRLEPHDADWVSARTQRSARYSGLAPGSYVFRVRAVDSRGRQSVKDASIRVEVLAPWWQTGWAYALYGLLFVASVVTVDRMQRRRLVRRERQRAQLREAELRAEALEAENRRKELELEKAREIEAMNARLEEQARRLVDLDEAKSRFFANISHEFRTPLTLILGLVESALQDAYGQLPDPLREHLLHTRRQAYRLLRLVNQLLDLARIESGTMTLQAEPRDLVIFLRELVRSFIPLAERRRLVLQFRSEADQLPFLFDADKLEKIFANLVSNALKFTPEGGKVWVSLSTREGSEPAEATSVEVVVKDTGPGIPREALENIFDRFVQVDGSTTRRHEGTGIGLALAKELVELHGGKILVESEEGFGSAFIVRLPMRPAAEHAAGRGDGTGADAEIRFEAAELALQSEILLPPSAHDPTEDGMQPKDERLTVLVVEDNADVRAFLRSQLEANYRVVEAADGEGGLEAARQHTPDLVLADVTMPRMDGYTFCRTLKEDEALRHIPVILLTARAAESDTIQGFDCGADDYLTKPFRVGELRARMTRLIASRRALRAQFSGEFVVRPSGVVIQAVDEAFLTQLLAVVEDHLAEHSFGVDGLADEVGLGRRQLERKVQALTGETPRELIRRMRLERAAQLLEAQAGTVAEVAYAVGYQSSSHFSTAFRKHFGTSPSEHAEKAT